MSIEVEKLKMEILPKLSVDLSIELQKSIVQYELQNFKESLQSISKTLNKFLIKYYFQNESLSTGDEKSIAELLRELKTKNIEVDREISTPLLRIDSKLSDLDSADSVIVESCMDACNTIFEWHIEKIEKNKQEERTSGTEVSKYVLEEVVDMYSETYSEESVQKNFSRVKSLLDKYPENKQIREVYLLLLSFTAKDKLVDEANSIFKSKNYSIRMSSVILVLLAESNFIDECLEFLDRLEKEYANESDLEYAKAFIYLNLFIQKNRSKDLEKAESILTSIERKNDYFYYFINSTYQIIKNSKRNLEDFKVLKNEGFFLEKLIKLANQFEKNQRSVKETEQNNSLTTTETTAIVSKISLDKKDIDRIEKPVSVSYLSKTENDVLIKQAKKSLENSWGLLALATFLNFSLNIVLNLIPGIGSILVFLFSGALSLGFSHLYLSISRSKPYSLSTIFIGFNRFGTSLAAYLLTILFSFLWALLFIVPGIIAGYSYMLTFFILADNPEMTAMDAINKSKEMMEGNKGKAFGLTVSFTGWFLLGIISFGIGYIWILPYFGMSITKLYRDIIKDNT